MLKKNQKKEIKEEEQKKRNEGAEVVINTIYQKKPISILSQTKIDDFVKKSASAKFDTKNLPSAQKEISVDSTDYQTNKEKSPKISKNKRSRSSVEQLIGNEELEVKKKNVKKKNL